MRSRPGKWWERYSRVSFSKAYGTPSIGYCLLWEFFIEITREIGKYPSTGVSLVKTECFEKPGKSFEEPQQIRKLSYESDSEVLR